MSWRATRDARNSRNVQVKEIQDKALASGQFERALGFRSSSPYPVMSGIPSPTGWINGARVWSFD